MFFNANSTPLLFHHEDYSHDVGGLCLALIDQGAECDVAALNTKAIKRQLLEEISNTVVLLNKLQSMELSCDANALTKLLCSPRKITRSALPFGETSSSRELKRMISVVNALKCRSCDLQYDDQGPLSLQDGREVVLHRGDAYLRRALDYFNAGRFARAFFDFEVARQFKIHHLDLDLDEHVGACLVFMSQYKHAIPYLDATLKDHPENVHVGLYRRIAEMMSPMPMRPMAESNNPILEQMLKEDAHPLYYLKARVAVLVRSRRVARVLMDCLNNSDRLCNIANTYGLRRLIDLLEVLPLYVGDDQHPDVFYLNKGVFDRFRKFVSRLDQCADKNVFIQRLNALSSRSQEQAVYEPESPTLAKPSRSRLFSSFRQDQITSQEMQLFKK